MTTWFTSDLHLGHGNIIGYCSRPSADVDHMDAELTHRWRERVMPDAVVWVLGDVAMGGVQLSEGDPIGHRGLDVASEPRPDEQASTRQAGQPF